MITTFRQGIISANTDQLFINFSGNKININANAKSVELTFVYGTTNYLFSEIEDVIGAWGPFNSGINYWIYWDLDIRTGLRTFGSTRIQPQFGSSLPISGLQVDLHFFDLNEKKMKVWDGIKWNEKLRVFAANVQGGSVIVPMAFGSQVGLSGNYSVGYILFDVNGKPIIRTDTNGNNYFITTEDKVHTQYDNRNAYKIDGLLIDGIAMEPIPAYHCLSWKGPRQLGVTSYVTYQFPCIGISIEDSGKNELNQFVTKGFVTNFNNWNWSLPANTPLFVGAMGEITTDVPQRYSLQKIGHIVSPDTIFVDIQEIILIDDSIPLVSPSPSPSASLTPTPSISPSTTPNPTQTVTPSVTTSPTLSPTPTPTLAASSTVTPTPTPSAIILAQPEHIAYLYSDQSQNQHVNLVSYDGNTILPLDDFNTSYNINLGLEWPIWLPRDYLQGIPSQSTIAYGRGYGYHNVNVSNTGILSDGTQINGKCFDFDSFYVEDSTSYSYIISDSCNTLFFPIYNNIPATMTNFVSIIGNSTIDGNVNNDGFNYITSNQNVIIASDGRAILYSANNPNNATTQTDKLWFITPTFVQLNGGTPEITIAKETLDIGQNLINDDPNFGNQKLYESKLYQNKEYITLGPNLSLLVYNHDTEILDSVISNDSFNLINGSMPSGGHYVYGSTINDKLFAIYAYLIPTVGFSSAPNNTQYYLVVFDVSVNNTATIITSTLLGDAPSYSLPRIRTSISSIGDWTIFTFTGFGIYKYIDNALVFTGLNELTPDDIDYLEIQDTWVGKFNIVPPTPTPSPLPPSITPTPSVTRTPGGLQTYSDLIVSNNPSNYWPQMPNDIIAANTLTVQGTTEILNDDFGNYLSTSIDAEGTTLGGILNTTINLTNNYSMEAWIKASNINGFQTIFGDNREGFYGLQFDADGTLNVYTDSDSITVVNSPIMANNYYHIVFTLDSSNNVLIYINGTSVTTSNPTLITNYNIGFIGTDADDEIFRGTISDPAIYNFVLTSSQVTNHYQYGLNNSRYGS